MPAAQPQYAPQFELSGFRGAPDTLAAMVEAAQGNRGERSMVVRSVQEEIVARVAAKDYLGEILAIRNWAAEHIRYTNDPLHVELVKDPQRMCEEILHRGSGNIFAPQAVGIGDCDDIAVVIGTMCLQLGRVCEYVAVGFTEGGHYSHVFVRVKEPKSDTWIVCDPVAGTDEVSMLQRVKEMWFVSLDELPSPNGGQR